MLKATVEHNVHIRVLNVHIRGPNVHVWVDENSGYDLRIIRIRII